jgi:hypothetical protein
MNLGHRILKFTASLKLAVIVILGLAIVSAWGTITEARYGDAMVAQKLVYSSVWMYLVLGLLCVNLIGVMIDRWPWKQHHMGFVLAHIGILTLLFGSWLTQKFGVDGSMIFEIGETSRHVSSSERDLSVIASLDGNTFNSIYDQEVDFLKHPIDPKKPFKVHLGSDTLEFDKYHHFAFRESEILPSDDELDGPAVRFQLQNANVNLNEWLRRDRTKAEAQVHLGPARVVLARELPEPSGMNEILLAIAPGSTKIQYAFYNKDRSLRLKGVVKESDTLETGWMGLKFRILRVLPHAKEKVQYEPLSQNTPASNSALRFKFRGQEYWLGLNSTQRIYLKDRVYFVSYSNRRLELAFPLTLNKFHMDTYQGTERAATYESEVEVPNIGNVTISMNEPLKHGGYTFYQSSFQRDEMGKAVVSILSVNHDPGRWIKYLGSLLIVLGSIVLFYFRRVKFVSMIKGEKS